MKLSKNIPEGISITISYSEHNYTTREALKIVSEYTGNAVTAKDIYDYFNVLRSN